MFRTMDGGKTWKKVLYVERRRRRDRPRDQSQEPRRRSTRRCTTRIAGRGRSSRADPRARIYRTDDGGDTWTKLTGGLPTGKIGRIGLDIYQKNPLILYALLENQNPRTPRSAATTRATCSADQPARRRHHRQRAVPHRRRRQDVAAASTDVNVAGGKAPYSFNQIRINPHDDQTVIVTSDSMYISRDGGKTWDTDFFRGVFGDFRSMWWDARGQGPHHPRQRRRRERVGRRRPDRRLLPEHGHRRGLRHRRRHGRSRTTSTAACRITTRGRGRATARRAASRSSTGSTVGPGDGMYNVIDPTDSRWVYNTRELNQMGRMDQKTGVRTNIAPTRPPGQPRASLQLDRADRAVAAQPEDRLRRRAGAVPLAQPRRHVGRDQPRPHDERSGEDRPERARTARSRRSPSRRSRPGTIWVGTDDGKVQLTQNHGGAWTDLDAGADGGRRACRALGQPRVRVAARRGDGVRLEERIPQRRLRALPLQDDRLRQDLDGDHGQPARLAHQRRRAGSQEPRIC